MRHETAKRPKRPTRPSKYNRVLLAVYWLSDEDGSTCWATKAEIAAEAGCSEKVAARHLRTMEDRGVIWIMAPTPEIPCRGRLMIQDAECFQERTPLDDELGTSIYTPSTSKGA